MNKQTVAYVVVGWNNADILKECFESINSQTYKDSQIIYVDNDSKDDSVSMVKEYFPSVISVCMDKNTGFARGNNIGIAKALEDKKVGYVVLLNSDARLEKDWTENIVKFAQKKPKGALFQGTTLDYYNHKIIDSTHIYLSQNGQAVQGNWRTNYVYEHGPKKVFGVNAAASLMSRKFLDEQPYKEIFDETLFMYLEDVDLATRATIMGWDNYLVASARAYHMGSASSGKNPGYSLYMTFRNNLGVLVKNLPAGILVKLLLPTMRSDFDTIRHLIRIKEPKGALSIIKGRAVSLLYLPIFIIKRRKLSRIRNIDSSYLWGLMKGGY